MNRSSRILAVIVLAAVAAAVALAVVKARKIDEAATEATDEIEAQLDALDPITRAAVVAKLSSDAVEHVKAQQS